LKVYDALLSLVRHKTINDLTARQLVVLMACRERNRTIRDLAEEMNVAKPAVTRAVDKLADYNLVVRKDDPDDRRSIFVVIRPSGVKYLRDTVGIE